MLPKPIGFAALMAAAIAAAVPTPVAAQTLPKCDPVDPVSDAGWSVVPSLEEVGTKDSAPYRAGADGDWFVDRTTTLLPFCNYYDEIGIYSLRSYTLMPQTTTERTAICRANAAVPPYAGACPPAGSR
jgi:hypothetical protein